MSTADKTLFEQWEELTANQTDDTIDAFWKEYCDAEIKIYSNILNRAVEDASRLPNGSATEIPVGSLQGTFAELVNDFAITPVMFMGFLDGVKDSLNNQLDPAIIDESSAIDLDIDLEKLYFNMLKADARHLHGLPGWDDILTDERRKEITKDFRRSGTVVKGEKIGRNDPCPCGSGKKYKHCCGKN